MCNRITLMILFLTVQGIVLADPVRTVKVGIFDNKPIVFQDSKGKAKGFALDVLQSISAQENWQLDYVHGTWAKVLEKLEKGEIDLLVGIAYSSERNQRFHFTQQTLLSNWGSVYRAHNTNITSLLDLRGKRIAMMKKSIHSKVFKILLAQFAIEYVPVEATDYHEVMRLVEQGKADAGVINRVFSIVNGSQYKALATPIMFNPVEVRYASPRTSNRELLNTIDRYLEEHKNNPLSAYHKAMNHWLGRASHTIIPAWLKWGVGSVLAVLLLALIMNVLLRRQVSRKTAALNEQRTQAEAAHELMNNIIERVNDGFVALDKDWCYTYMNSRAARLLQREKPEDLIGKHIWTEYPEGVGQPFHKAYLQSLETQQSITFEEYYEPWEQWFENRIYPSPDGLTIYFTEITERKHSLQALTESEEKYRNLFDNANDAIYLIDQKTQKILDTNKKAVDMLGYSVDEFKQMTIPDLHPEEESLALPQKFAEAAESGSISEVNGFHHMTKDGRLVPIEVNASMVQVGGKQLRLSIVRDVTERKRAENELRHSEQYNRMLFEQSPIGLALSRMNGELFDVNPAYANIIGRSVEETKQLTYWEITPNEYTEDEERQLECLNQTGRYGPYEKEYIHKNGHLVPVRLSGMILKKDGESFIWSSVEDITEHKLAEQSLNRVNRALMVLTSCNEALIRATNETDLLDNICNIIVEVGHYPLVWIGYAEHDENKSVTPVAQKGFSTGYLDEIFISWADNDLGRGPTGLAIRTGQLSVNKNIQTNPDFKSWYDAAQKYDFTSSIALPVGTLGSTYGALNIYSNESDAFDEKEMHLLQELADDLGFGITSLRTQNELQQAQKMEAIGQLTGGIAHDFNNILTSIMGYTELALDLYTDDSNPELAVYLNEVSLAGERARDLIAQMLTFSRATVTNSKSISLEPVVNEVIKLLQSTFPSSIQIHTDIDSSVSNIRIASTQLHQMVMNLCINSRDASEGEGIIDIKIRQLIDITAECNSCHGHIKGDFVELSVGDTGSGIESTVLEKIFNPFYTTKDIGKGTGMGLSMVHGIVHEHGGHILVETVMGKGTTFRLLFPAVSKEEHSTHVEELAFTESLPRTNGEHLLIVDDDESVATFISELLKRSGYQVTMMTSSKETLSLFKKNPQRYDLVITDQTMPDITGGELASKLLQVRPDIPIILCTGYSEKIDEKSALAIGIQRFLEKPIGPKVLLESVSRLLFPGKH